MSQFKKQVTGLVLLVVVATPAMMGHGLHLLSGSHDHSQCGVSLDKSSTFSRDSCGHDHSCCLAEPSLATVDAFGMIVEAAGQADNSRFTVRCRICEFLGVAQLRPELIHADFDVDKVCFRQLPPQNSPSLVGVEGVFLARGPPAFA